MSDFVHKLKVFLGVQEDYQDTEDAMGLEQNHVEDDVVPIRRERTRRQSTEGRNQSKPALIGLSGGQGQSKMYILEPKAFADVKEYVTLLKGRKSLIVRLDNVDQAEAQRIVDFLSGTTHALEGNMRKLGETIFCFTPSSVVIEGDLEADFFEMIKNEGE